jgi:hypothetical protein
MSRAMVTALLLVLLSFETEIEEMNLQSVDVIVVVIQNLAWKSVPGQATTAFNLALVGFRLEMLFNEMFRRGLTMNL